MKKPRVYYVLSTHWDREWYQAFQDFRYRLVNLMDHIVDGYASGNLKGPFQTDGQTIVIEDYLEIHPERRSQVESLLRDGKLTAGPWYVMPDEFLISGESLIRNLRMGRDLVRSYGGKPSDAGFVCDIFGHNSQLPQIFAGFGLKGAILWRGINRLDRRLVRWQGADGTQLLTYLFANIGYCDFCAGVRHSFDRNHVHTPEQVQKDVLQYVAKESKVENLDSILAFDGGDHQGWDREFYDAMTKFSAQPDAPFEFVHGDLDAFLNAIIPQMDRITTVIKGELREPGKIPHAQSTSWLIPGVLSSRVWIKQTNADCESLLCQWAEPFSAFAASALGCEYPQGYLDVAWKWLIKNHPHDSICGCSIDQVHEDMKFRFSQCRTIADRLTIEATKKLAASVEGEVKDGELRAVVFNPSTVPLDETAELTLHIPADWPAFSEFFGFEDKPAFRIFDAHNNEIPYQRLSQARNQIQYRVRSTRFPEPYTTYGITVSLPLQIPALGYTTLTVRSGEPYFDVDNNRTMAYSPIRHPEVPGLATSERSMANEFLEVIIESNGTLTLTDKRSNQVYSRLLTFEDTADIGDGWYHGIAVNDQTHVSSACRSEVALVHNGPMLTTFRVRTTMSVPAEFSFDRMVRSEARADLVIDSKISLRPKCPYLEVETTIHNTARDHRVRVLLPSGASAETYLADSVFDVVERPIALTADNHTYRELEVETKPQQTWTAVSDDRRGLAVVSTGLLESAVRDLPERPIALTLFRATRRTVFTDGEPAGQLQGPLNFRYRIVSLTGKPNHAALCLLGQRLAAKIRSAQLLPADVRLYRTETTLPAEKSFLQIDGGAIVTSLRQVNAAWELRMFNPAETKIETTIRSPFTHATPVNLESQPTGPEFSRRDGKISIPLNPKQILTLQLK